MVTNIFAVISTSQASCLFVVWSWELMDDEMFSLCWRAWKI